MTSDMKPALDLESEVGIQSRSYQLEMLQESLKRNIIVAMDTGSGKTHIAVLRIMAEIERTVDDRIVWFLAPSVALCEQQVDVLRSHIPALQTKLLVGSDNVDRWSDQHTWDAALRNVHCVVSTHAVLADALGHGFVRMQRLSLLVFDEAHHCARNHPANRIMRDFYYPAKDGTTGDSSVPSILGLTASTIIRSNLSEIRVIETNLDAICRTPRLHRQELMKHVHRPEIRCITYALANLNCLPDSLVFRLRLLVSRTERTTLGERSLQRQLIKLSHTAFHVLQELGEWAAEYFVREVVVKVTSVSESRQSYAWGWDDQDTMHCADVLASLGPLPELPDLNTLSLPLVSDKVRQLVALLQQEHHTDFAGIVFVRRRAVVAVLSRLLSTYPGTKDRFCNAPFIGLSGSAKRKLDVADILNVDHRTQAGVLDLFRQGHTKLVIATDVLEEGIDIANCHMVICFDPPSNLKSFIQRRGRARKEKSTFALLAAAGDPSSPLAIWLKLEQEMLKLYQDEKRELEAIAALEEAPEEVEYQFRVPLTGSVSHLHSPPFPWITEVSADLHLRAMLTAKSAMAHLYHFCAELRTQPYTDSRPKFSFHTDESTGTIWSTVTLPASVSASVRQSSSARSWVTEKAAAMDAAFQAYLTLFHTGLVNANLLPLQSDDPVIVGDDDDDEDQSSHVEIEAQLDPWSAMNDVLTPDILYRTKLTVNTPGDGRGETPLLTMSTSMPLSTPKPFNFYWDRNSTQLVSFDTSYAAEKIDAQHLDVLAQITHLLLESVHRDRNQDRDQQHDFVTLFAPDIEDSQLPTWLIDNQGRRNALECLEVPPHPEHMGFVRSPTSGASPHLFQSWHQQPPREIFVDCVPLPARRNFLNPFPRLQMVRNSDDEHDKPFGNEKQLYPAEQCTFDRLPVQEARKALMIPAIMQHVQVYLTAERLRHTIFGDIPIRNVEHLVTAISTPAAQLSTNYQQYEFLGDSLLKFCVSRHLYASHPTWHEEYLTQYRSSHVSNAHLTTVALKAGLGPFVMTTPFRTRRWRMPHIGNTHESELNKRSVSRKVLADVVEALIGAAFLDEASNFQHLLNIYGRDPTGPTVAMTVAERVIGRPFRHPALLREALTHPSLESDIATESYQRLEFLGDAVLDMVVVSNIWRSRRNLSPGRMTMIKAAMVNSGLLGFFCLRFGVEEARIAIKQQDMNTFVKQCSVERVQLWRVMRHHNEDIVAAQRACRERYERLEDDIQSCLDHGTHYPWTLLAQLRSDKFYSDIIESVMGAIFVDTDGELTPCTAFAERIGLIPYLRRLIVQNVDVEQPKTRLQQLVGSKALRYVVEAHQTEPRLYRCHIEMDGVPIGIVAEGASRDEATIRAADEAIPYVQGG